jgi:hypothetical protein
MALRQVNKSFRQIFGDWNAWDAFSSNPHVSAYSAGATLIDVVDLGATVSSSWKLISVSIQAYLAIIHSESGSNFSPVYGRFGKIKTALITKPDTFSTSGQYGTFVTPMLPLPQDSTLTVDLWDPAIDPLPPRITSVASPPPSTPQPSHTPGTLLAVQTSIQLPIAIDIVAAEQVCVGIWILPSLLAFTSASFSPSFLVLFGMSILQASYVLNIDDGS